MRACGKMAIIPEAGTPGAYGGYKHIYLLINKFGIALETSLSFCLQFFITNACSSRIPSPSSWCRWIGKFTGSVSPGCRRTCRVGATRHTSHLQARHAKSTNVQWHDAVERMVHAVHGYRTIAVTRRQIPSHTMQPCAELEDIFPERGLHARTPGGHIQ